MSYGNRWKHGYTGDGINGEWFSGKGSELVRLEHGGKEKRKLKHQSNTGKEAQEGEDIRNSRRK
jgi:hypothetical protein